MTDRMQALVKTAEGEGNLERQRLPVPDIETDEVLIEIAYCGICGSDLHIRRGTHPCEPPVVLGHEFSGIVARTGQNVTDFSPGDRVGFRRSWNPFPGVDADGGFAEYMRAPADVLWTIPEELSLEMATQFETIRVPMTLVYETAQLEAGERVVVSGPGPIGLLVTNVARMAGGSPITVIGTAQDSEQRLPTAEQVGADETRYFDDETLAEIADDPPAVWFETSGAPAAVEAAVDTVASGGRVICSGLGEGSWNLDINRLTYENLDIRGQWGGSNALLEPAVEAMQSGELDVSAIISDVIGLSHWREAFDRADRGDGIKILLDPSQ